MVFGEVIKPNTKIRSLVGAKKGDIVLCTSGFINPYKGVDKAVKALKLLPSNYRLAILGGINPDSGNLADLTEVRSIIDQLGLTDRVYISGFIQDDNLLSSYMGACDIALYPYDVSYYKMASSDAINKAFISNTPVIAFPTPSFKEINDSIPGAVTLTNTTSEQAIAKQVLSLDSATQITKATLYKNKHGHKAFAQELSELYGSLGPILK